MLNSTNKKKQIKANDVQRGENSQLFNHNVENFESALLALNKAVYLL